MRVLHIRRHNLLRTYLSHVHASRTEEWIGKGDAVRSPPPVGLDFDACRSFFEKTRRWEREYDARLSGHPKLDLYYEDMVGGFDEEMTRVQTFLGLPLEGIRPRTRKQSQLPLSKAILNYEELRERFADTEWDSFFDDTGAEPAVATAGRVETL